MAPFFPRGYSGVGPRSLEAPLQDILPDMVLPLRPNPATYLIQPSVITRSLPRSDETFTLPARPHQGERAVRVRHRFFGVDLVQSEEAQYLDGPLELGVRHVFAPAAYQPLAG